MTNTATAIAFTAGVVVFFMIAYFVPSRVPNQDQILRFLASICAAGAGSLFTGDAIVHFEGSVSTGTKLTAQGTAGLGLFILIFVSWNWFRGRQVAPDAFNFSIPTDWTFEQTIRTLARARQLIPEFAGFTQDELDTPLHGQAVNTDNALQAISIIGKLGKKTIRAYKVEIQGGLCKLTVKA